MCRSVTGILGFIIRWVYWFAVPIIGVVELAALIAYGHQLSAAGAGGKVCLAWFSILGSVGNKQLLMYFAPIWHHPQ